MKYLFISTIFLLSTLGSLHESVASVSYGDLYLAQPQSQVERQFVLMSNYSSGLGSPNYNLRGLQVGFDFWISRYFLIGTSYTHYWSSPTELHRTLSEQLRLNSAAISYVTPQQSWVGKIGYNPLHGLVNVFGKSVVTTDLVVGVGAGITKYSDQSLSPNGQFFIEERILIHKGLGISFGYSHIFEKVSVDSNTNSTRSNWTGRGQLQLGAYVEF